MRTDQETNRFSAIDPRTGAELGEYADAGPAEVAAAAREAAAAAADRALLDDSRRARFLAAAAAGLRAAGEDVVGRAEAETGLPTARLNGELERTAGQLEAFGALISEGSYVDAYIDHADADAKPIPRPDVRRMLVPIGPVAVFGASNFPLAFSVAGGDTAAALAAGCPVLVKGHPAHPGTGELVAAVLTEAASDAGLPDGAFSLLASASAAVGEELVDRPEIAAVAFTGSFAAGSALFERAAARPAPIPVFAEMSSVNPLVVTAGALAARGEKIAAGLATAIGGSAGQLCTKPGLAFVPAGDAGDRLEGAVAEALAEQGEQVLLTGGIRDALLARTETLDRLAVPVEPFDGGAVGGAGFATRSRVYSTDVASLIADGELREESFGPVALLVRYRGDDELLGALEAIGGQLTASLHLEPDEVDAAGSLVAALQRIAGRLVFNGFPTGVSVTAAMHHGGPYPATTNPSHTSVGMTAIARFLRPVAWQDAPAELLPEALREENPLGIARHVDGAIQPSGTTP